MKRSLKLVAGFLCCVVFAACLSNVQAAEKADSTKTAAKLLPASTIAFVELSRPKPLLDMVLEHPLKQRVEKLDQIQNAMQGKQFQQFQAVVSLIELQIGMKWNEALGALAEGGISIGFDQKTEGLALIVQSKDQATLEKLRETFFKLARDEAKRNENPDPIKTAEYRGVTAYSIGSVKFATLGGLLVLVNNDDLGKAILDNYLDGESSSLESNERFQAAREMIADNPSVWGYVDVETLRKANPDNGIYKKKSNNVLIELLVGGLLVVAQKTPYVAGSLNFDERKVALKIAAPHDSSWVGEEREYYFGSDGKGAAPPLLRPEQTLLSLSTYRDFSNMWLRSADIFEDNVDAKFAQANATLSTLFSGKDFGEDVLGSFKPEVQFVAVRQKFEEGSPIPAIKLPAFAAIFRFQNPEEMRGDFRRMFQSLIGFLNVVGAQNGQPQLDQDIEKNDGNEILSSSYVPEVDRKESEPAKINFNFSPSVAFAAEYFIVSSTRELARELTAVAVKSKHVNGVGGERFIPNTQLEVNLPVLRSALNDNRKQLVTQNILSEGSEREEAEKQVDLILEAVGLFQNLKLHLGTNGKRVQFELEVNLAK